jgi:N-terminal half of MaoC dehydratase
MPGGAGSSYITAEMREAVGREITRFTSHPISDSDIRKWLIAVHWPEQPPQPSTDSHGRFLAPEEFNPFAWSVARGTRSWHKVGVDPEGYLGIARPQLKATVNGAVEVEYGARMRSGDVITAISQLCDYEERDGRMGRLLLRTTEDVWTNQDDEFVKRFRLTLISY